MPVSEYYGGSGEKVMRSMKEQYGPEKGERVFYATANKTGQTADEDCMDLKHLIDSAYDEHVGFKKLEGELAQKKGVHDPAAVAASIGRKKYGEAEMARKSAAGRASDADVELLRELLW